MFSEDLKVKPESSLSSIAKTPVHMHFTDTACSATQVDTIQPNTTDHVAQAQHNAQLDNVADSSASPSKRLLSDESKEHDLQQEINKCATYCLREGERPGDFFSATFRIALSVHKIVHTMIMDVGVAEAVSTSVAHHVAKDIVRFVFNVFLFADANFDEKIRISETVTSSTSELLKQCKFHIGLACSETGNACISPGDAENLFVSTMKIYNDVFDRLCSKQVNPIYAVEVAERVVTTAATLFRSIWLATHGTNPTIIPFANIAFAAISSAIYVRTKVYSYITSCLPVKQRNVNAANAAALFAYSEFFASFDAISKNFIAIGISPAEAEESASAVLKTMLVSCVEVYNTCVSRCLLAQTRITLDERIGLALHGFKTSFSCYLKVYLEVFTFAIFVKATSADAITVSKVFLDSVKLFYGILLSNAFSSGAIVTDAVNVFNHIPDVAAKFYCSIFATILTKTNANPADAWTVACLALDSVIGSHYSVFTTLTRLKVASLKAVNASKDALNVFNRFYRGVFVAIFTKTNAEPGEAHTIACSALSDLVNIHRDVFVNAIIVKATPTAATRASRDILAIASRFYHRFFTTAINDQVMPKDVANAAHLAIGDIDKIWGFFAAIEAHVTPLVTAKTSDVAAEVSATPLPAAKTADAAAEVPTVFFPASTIADVAVGAFGTIYAKITQDFYVATDACAKMCTGVVSPSVDDKYPSLEQNAIAVYTMTLNDLHTAVKLAGIDRNIAPSAAEKVAATVRDVYLSEFKNVCANPGFAGTRTKHVIRLVFAAATAICNVYRYELLYFLKVNAFADDAPAAQADGAIMRLGDAL